MVISNIILVLLASLWLEPSDSNLQKQNIDAEIVYSEAQKHFYKKDYEQALDLFKQYIELSKSSKADHSHIIWAIDQIGRIYLREQRDPDSAIGFFNKFLEDQRFTEAEEDAFAGWISAAKDWKSVGQFPQMTKDPDKQFDLGKRFFEAGISKAQFPMSNEGNADFAIAQSYLILFIIENDQDSRIGQALYMMGEIRRRLWNDNAYWVENFYFKELIRRFPHTPLAWKSYQAMEEDIHFGYSGSSGDHTPSSILQMLAFYRKMAQPEEKD